MLGRVVNNHLFSTYAKPSKKPLPLTPSYVHVRLGIKEVELLVLKFSGKFCALTKWMITNYL